MQCTYNSKNIDTTFPQSLFRAKQCVSSNIIVYSMSEMWSDTVQSLKTQYDRFQLHLCSINSQPARWEIMPCKLHSEHIWVVVSVMLPDLHNYSSESSTKNNEDSGCKYTTVTVGAIHL